MCVSGVSLLRRTEGRRGGETDASKVELSKRGVGLQTTLEHLNHVDTRTGALIACILHNLGSSILTVMNIGLQLLDSALRTIEFVVIQLFMKL
jgi:hypothetical protein